MNFAKVHVHTICPGFEAAYTADLRSLWDALNFYVPGYNFGYEKFVAGNQDVYSPVTNPQIKIVHLCRNPLDQAVSYFRHARNNINAHKRSYLDADGNEVAIRDEQDFLHQVGLEAFIKQYFTFHLMHELYPDNVLLVSYENMTRDPVDAFARILGHFGFSIDDENKHHCFARALESSSPESLKKIETALETTLARDQNEVEESHLRGGEIGKWKNYFNDSDLKFVDNSLRAFKLNLDLFTIE